jgi:UDP-N-acetylmuramoyl-tripeptide--D-alanyl-D-alanine ligase
MTNLGKDHLEFLGTPEGVLAENRKLLDALPKDGTAVINLDDLLLKPLATTLPFKKITYGKMRESEVGAIEIVSHAEGVRFTLRVGKETHPVTLQIPGDLQVDNAMAAAACAHALAISLKDIVQGLESFKPAAMRMEVRVRADKTVLVNDAYNANPSSMQASIESFCRSFMDRPRWLVLGDMRELGTIARTEHEALGRWISEQPVNRIYLYGRDTRFILKGLSEKGFQGSVERYHKKRYLIGALERAVKNDSKPAILFKASRRLELEKVSHALLSLPS